MRKGVLNIVGVLVLGLLTARLPMELKQPLCAVAANAEASSRWLISEPPHIHLDRLSRCPFPGEDWKSLWPDQNDANDHSGQRQSPNISCAAHFPTHWTGSLRGVNFYFDVRGQSL